MKQVIVGAALCGAAVAFAAAANAANDNSDFLYGNFLNGSTDALVLGPTGIPTPSANYISTGLDLYMDPLGYEGTQASTEALTLPNSYDFFESVPGGVKILVDESLSVYSDGEQDRVAAGMCSSVR